MCVTTRKTQPARPFGSTLQRLFSSTCTSLVSSYQEAAPFPRKFTWQTEAGSITETITEPDNSDDLRPNSLTSRVKLGPALVAVPLWLLKWCWASMSLVELAPLWGERYIIRNQGAQSIPIGHWWALGVTGKMSRCQGNFRVSPGSNLIPSVLGLPVRKRGQQVHNLKSSRINMRLKNWSLASILTQYPLHDLY